jgi:membrane protease YdiL (CAAX protease family)
MTVPTTGAAGRDAGIDASPGTTAGWVRASGAAWFVGLCLLVAAISTLASGAMQAIVPFALAFIPAVIAIGLAWREGHGALRRLLHSLTIRPQDRRWYLVLLLPVAWALAVIAIAVALGQPTAGLFDHLAPTALIVPLVVFLPALAEELAWRGYAVPRVMVVMSPLRAALVLGIPWALIHVVLHLPGGMNESAAILPGVVTLFAYSIVLTWVFLGTGGSVLMAALVHMGLNAVVPLMSGLDPELAWDLRAVLAAVIALTIVGLGGFRRFAAKD